MKKVFNSLFFIAFIALFALIVSDFAEAKGGRSFGGSKSFGGSRSSGSTSKPSTGMQRQSAPSSSFGGTKSTNTPSTSNMGRSGAVGASSLNNNYTSKYGAPRRTMTSNDMPGLASNYRVHDYGGFSSGLMTGYLMGSTSWMWSMPFHPAFYYSRPTYYNNPDGTVSVYPPTFSFLKLFVGLALFIVVLWIIIKIVKRVRGGGNGDSYSQSSFS